MRKVLVILLATVMLTIPFMAAADEAADLKKKIVMDQKKLMVIENMEFSAEEADKFWPLYEKYQEKLFANSQQYAKLIAAYASVYKTMTDTEALVLVDEYYQVQEEHLAIMKQFSDDLKVALPGQKVFRYLQVENKIAAIARFEIAKRIPMAQ
ncbi:hypothetical protein [Desulfopila aestuarii]|uniref:Uncharacterized protein n=1 Tax=Desulfopila aestuarii DSM 18488 TaxID=1121416 RepID=A0A1M7XVJ9_9BACT|nr:hypothetical protein [Desulfopila aestuarii]SHO42660.1 hypothetical protein SAMN02745220_00078 [Desulfopila aestuarii DSM 18488]